MLRKNSPEEFEFDFFSIRKEFDEACKIDSKSGKNDKRNLSNSTQKELSNSYTGSHSRSKNNLFIRIFRFIPKEEISVLFEIFQREFDTNKKSVINEIYSLRNEINFEYKKKLLEILLIFLTSFKYYNLRKKDSNTIVNDLNTKKPRKNKIITENSFTVKGTPKIIFKTIKDKPNSKEMEEIQTVSPHTPTSDCPKNVNIIYNYNETKNLEVSISKDKKEQSNLNNNDGSFDGRKTRMRTHKRDLSNFPESSKKPKSNESERKINLNLPKYNYVLADSAQDNFNDKSMAEKTNENRDIIIEAEDGSGLKNNKFSCKDTYNSGKQIRNIPNIFEASNNSAYNTDKINPNNNKNDANMFNQMFVENTISQFKDARGYNMNNMCMQNPYLMNKDMMHFNNYNNMDHNYLMGMNFASFKPNLGIPMIRHKMNLNSPQISPFSGNPNLIYPWQYSNNNINQNAFKTSQFQLYHTQPINEINNTPLITMPQDDSVEQNDFKNKNPFYLNKKDPKNSKKDREDKAARRFTRNNEKVIKNNKKSDQTEFLNKKKKREGGNSYKFEKFSRSDSPDKNDNFEKNNSSKFNEGDSFGEKSYTYNSNKNSEKESDGVQVKLFTDDISNEIDADNSNMEIDKSILMSTNLGTLLENHNMIENIQDPFYTSDSNLKMPTKFSGNDEDVIKTTIKIFSEQFTLNSLEILKSTLNLPEENARLIQEYLIHRNYPKTKREYIFLYKKENEDKGLYLKIDPVKKKYSLIRHRIFKE